MQKQAYPEFIGENLQDRSGSCGARFAGCAHRDVGYIAMIRCDPRGSLLGRHDCGRQVLCMEGRLIEIYLTACGKDDVKRQRRLAQLSAKLRVKIFAFRIGECGNAHVPRIPVKRAGADEHGIRNAAQKSHHESILGAAAAYLCATRAAWNAK